MATTSWLYKTMGLRGCRLLRTEYRGNEVYFHVELQHDRRTCRDCGAWCCELKMAGGFERTFHALPVGRRRQFVVLHGHRQQCVRCGKTLREPVRFAKGKTRYLRAFGRYVVELSGLMPMKHVAQLLGVGWDLVKEIHKGHLTRRFGKRDLSAVRYLAVDEFATHKGHKYMTVVLDLETGEILHAHEGKGAAALRPFLEEVKRRRAPLVAVAMDMSEAYASAVREIFGDRVDIVYDTYHVVAMANRAIDETRRALVRSLTGDARQVVKGTRFLLLKGLENLAESSLERLMRLMSLNEPLYQAYLLKEDLRQFWNAPDRVAGEAFLQQWTAQAREAGAPFQTLADTLDQHRAGLLSYFTHRISSGPLEGLNNKIKVLKRQGYGFRDMEYFKLRLYGLHEARQFLTG